MNKMGGLVTATTHQTENWATEICKDMVAYRISPADLVEVPAGVLLNIIGRLGAAEQALQDALTRITNMEYSV